jgi:hypothetical protein
VLSTVGSLKATATVATNTTTANSIQQSESTSFQRQGNFQLAQGLVGQCRAATKRIFVYSQRSTTSQTVRTLAPNEQVTLADDGAAGWVAINSPEVGYVRASDLTTCQAVNPPTTQPSAPSPAPSPSPQSRAYDNDKPLPRSYIQRA